MADGSYFCELQEKVASGEISEEHARDVANFFNDVWGPHKLKYLGQRFLALKPKRARSHPKKKALQSDGPQTSSASSR